MVRGDFLIFSSKRSFLLRKRMMDVSVNHLLLQIESNNFKLSCIRFYYQSRNGNRQEKLRRCGYLIRLATINENCLIQLKRMFDYGGLVFVQHLIVFGHGHAKDDGRHVFEAMDPLLSLGTLTSHIEQSILSINSSRFYLQYENV